MAVFKPFVTKNGIDINNFKLVNLANPDGANDAVNKNYSTNASNITSGVLSVNYGGTGAIDKNAALTNLLPTQTSDINGYALKTNGSAAEWSPVFSGSYNDLNDVPTFASVAYSGLLEDISNVDLVTTPPQEGDILGYDSLLQKWKPMVPPGAVTSIAELNDVAVVAPTEGSVLAYDNNTQKWTSTNTLSNITLDGGIFGAGE